MFRALLKIESNKNNVSYVITDVTGTQIYAKQSGGCLTKRGTSKNSQKVIDMLYKNAVASIGKLGIEDLTIFHSQGRYNRAHKFTSKYVLRTINTTKIPDIEVNSNIINNTPIAKSKITVKGGTSRGRRV